MNLKNLPIAALSIALTLTISSAMAQKSKDTLRYPISDMEPGIDTYTLPGNFANVWGPSVFDYLIDFDATKGTFIPHLAKSFSQPDSTTYEFEVRDDIKWHDGQSLDADDVVYTLKYLSDPKVTLRYKTRWTWIKSVEKLSSHKVRITTTNPVPYGLMWMASHTPIYPEHAHAPAANKTDFASKPIGTGPLRVISMEKNAGIVAEKYPGYFETSVKPGSGVGRVIAEPIMDVGSLVAMMLTDKVDVARSISSDQAEALAATGRFETSLTPPTVSYTFLGFPSKGTQAGKPLADARVRKAIMMAIDRRALESVKFSGIKQKIVSPEALCSKEQLGCGYTKQPPQFDLAGAKKLLAEAGYADGFDVTISAFPNSQTDATAITGMLRAAGIRASLQIHPAGNRVQMINQGRVEIGYYAWDGGGVFEASGPIERHVSEYDDPELAKLAAPTHQILDDTERRKASVKVFDYITDHAYAYVVLGDTAMYTHTKEVRLNTDAPRALPVNPHEFTWK